MNFCLFQVSTKCEGQFFGAAATAVVRAAELYEKYVMKKTERERENKRYK
jgi:hypothetical protein